MERAYTNRPARARDGASLRSGGALRSEGGFPNASLRDAMMLAHHERSGVKRREGEWWESEPRPPSGGATAEPNEKHSGGQSCLRHSSAVPSVPTTPFRVASRRSISWWANFIASLRDASGTPPPERMEDLLRSAAAPAERIGERPIPLVATRRIAVLVFAVHNLQP